jgi:hypothetical protein
MNWAHLHIQRTSFFFFFNGHPPRAHLGKLLVEALLELGGELVEVRAVHVVRHAVRPNQRNVLRRLRLDVNKDRVIKAFQAAP